MCFNCVYGWQKVYLWLTLSRYMPSPRLCELPRGITISSGICCWRLGDSMDFEFVAVFDYLRIPHSKILLLVWLFDVLLLTQNGSSPWPCVECQSEKGLLLANICSKDVWPLETNKIIVGSMILHTKGIFSCSPLAIFI